MRTSLTPDGDAMTTDPVVGRRGAGALLRDRTFGPFFVGRVMSSCGNWITNVAAAVLMFELTGSAFMVGTVSMVQFLGPLVLSVWTGALTDRVNRRKLLMGGRVISGTAVGILALVLAVRGTAGFGGPVVLLAGALVIGVGFALSSPAGNALVPALVPDEDLEQALALNSAGPSIARTVGPAVGAGLLVLGGPALAFAVAAASQWINVTVLFFIRARPSPRPRDRPEVLGGVRYLLTDRKAGFLVLGVAAIAVGADPVVTLTPPVADELGGGSELVGVLASSFGVGAVALTFLIHPLRRYVNLRLLGVGGFWILAAGLLVVALNVNPVVAAAGFLLSGAGFMLATVALNTRIQRRVPDELRGRVMALWAVAFLGSRPIAALLNGSVADLVSVRAALVTAALVTLAASLFARVSYGQPARPH